MRKLVLKVLRLSIAAIWPSLFLEERWVTLTVDYDLKVPVMSTLTKHLSPSRTSLYVDSC